MLFFRAKYINEAGDEYTVVVPFLGTMAETANFFASKAEAGQKIEYGFEIIDEKGRLVFKNEGRAFTEGDRPTRKIPYSSIWGYYPYGAIDERDYCLISKVFPYGVAIDGEEGKIFLITPARELTFKAERAAKYAYLDDFFGTLEIKEEYQGLLEDNFFACETFSVKNEKEFRNWQARDYCLCKECAPARIPTPQGIISLPPLYKVFIPLLVPKKEVLKGILNSPFKTAGLMLYFELELDNLYYLHRRGPDGLPNLKELFETISSEKFAKSFEEAANGPYDYLALSVALSYVAGTALNLAHDYEPLPEHDEEEAEELEEKMDLLYDVSIDFQELAEKIVKEKLPPLLQKRAKDLLYDWEFGHYAENPQEVVEMAEKIGWETLSTKVLKEFPPKKIFKIKKFPKKIKAEFKAYQESLAKENAKTGRKKEKKEEKKESENKKPSAESLSLDP